MGYLLRMSGELHDWLTGLRDGDPAAARSVGEAVTALMTEGASLGPPLVIPVVRPALEVTVSEALYRAYQRGVEWARAARRREADAEAVAGRLRQQLAERESGGSSPEPDPELAGLRQRLAQVTETGRKLTELSSGRERQVDAFRTRTQVLRARYTTAQAEADIPEVIAEAGPDRTARPASEGRPGSEARPAHEGHDGDRAAAARLREIEDEIEQELNAVPWEQGGDLIPQAGLKELRPGAPDPADIAGVVILFAVEPPGTALLLAVLEGRAALRDQYDTAVSLSSQALREARSAEAVEAGAAGAAGEAGAWEFGDTEGFIDEFFPGQASEVEAGAAALAARVRGQRLAELRKRLGLSRAEVARRLGVRPERVAAIEGAAPGATEVRALAGYVEALGGRLEIIADVGGEPVVLR